MATKTKKKRGKRKNTMKISKKLRFLGVNSAGLGSKMTTFRKVIKELEPSMFFIQETKFKDYGKLRVENYIIYELLRKTNVGGGGLAIGVIKELNPALVREGDGDIEALSVEISLKNLKIRCCTAYGCQENEKVERKEKFWNFLDEEVAAADHSGSGFILQFDGNLWAGNNLIKGDPRPQNRNGKMLEEFLVRNPHLNIVNTLPQCQGLITRKRRKNDKFEESILDFFIVCNKVLPFVTKMVIDEEKKFILTNYKQYAKTNKAIDSDHMTVFMDLDIDIDPVKQERVEMYNFKEEASKNIFKKLTTETDVFTECFNNNIPLLEQIENWTMLLNKFCSKSFKKIRIRRKNLKPIKASLKSLINKRNVLIKYNDPASKLISDGLTKRIYEIEAEENRNQILKDLKDFSANPENINVNNVWRRLKRICPKNGPTLPIAKKDHQGRLVTGPKDIKNLLATEYKDRLRSRPIRPDLKTLKARKTKIFEMKLKKSIRQKSPDWTMAELDQALKDLKRNKSRDPFGYSNELFKHDVIGDDLKRSLLIMMNSLKQQGMIPKHMNIANITTVPKKGSKFILKNERGIFRVSVLRTILMRLIYNTKYPIIDKNISECQMGARKEKGSKNNIFVLNGIIHEVLKSKKMKPVALQIYDYAQMFDSIDLKEALSDIYDVGVNDDTLPLLYKANAEVFMSVKTPAGLTDRQTVHDSVLQGDTWGSILASVQVDSIGKACLEAGYFYKYKDKLPVGFLGLVDDIVGITEVGHKAQQLNSLINLKTAEKSLQFGVNKCKAMIVGKSNHNYLHSKIMVDKWEVNYTDNLNNGNPVFEESFQGLVEIEKVKTQTYLGFVISSSGDNMAHIRSAKSKGTGVISKILSKLKSLNLQKYYFECAMILLNAILRPSLLFACDMIYNMKESEIRQLERVEEHFLRKVLNTGKGCPIVQLYLEMGHIPARVEIQKMRCLFLHYILQQNETSTVKKMFKLQLEMPTRGDWASTCIQDLKEFEIKSSLEEIKMMSKYTFSKLLRNKANERAIKYLTEKQRVKGKKIQYLKIEMAEYLSPCNTELSIEEKQKLFAIRNQMTNFEMKSYEKPQNCVCGKIESIEHFYSCEILNKEENEISFQNIYSNNIKNQIKIFRRIQNVLQNRENIIVNSTPCDLMGSATFSSIG